jgi:lipopolysaccharide/colanic/teichoic acid biosynthesis glycosyltransferase
MLSETFAKDRLQLQAETVSSKMPASTAVGDAKAVAGGVSVKAAGPGLIYRIVTRVIEIVVSITVLLVFAPLMLVVAILMDSPGPVLFRQVRVGINRRHHNGSNWAGEERRVEDRYGKPFTIYKFRSMYIDARERFPARYAYEHTDEQRYTHPMKALMGSESGAQADGTVEDLGEDPRVTPLGRWLRRTSFDELPNFFNVLWGDLALVGPRPDIVENVRHYLPEHMRKFDVKPGVTGLAQVMGRGTLSFHQTNEYDIRYVNQQSLPLDLNILIKTFWVTIRREGAY